MILDSLTVKHLKVLTLASAGVQTLIFLVVTILGQYLGLIYIAAAIFIAAFALLPEESITKLVKHQCGYWSVFGFSALSVLCSVVETAVLAYWIARGSQPANVAMILFNVGIVG